VQFGLPPCVSHPVACTHVTLHSACLGSTDELVHSMRGSHGLTLQHRLNLGTDNFYFIFHISHCAMNCEMKFTFRY
jgi:hypothetical protein